MLKADLFTQNRKRGSDPLQRNAGPPEGGEHEALDKTDERNRRVPAARRKTGHNRRTDDRTAPKAAIAPSPVAKRRLCDSEIPRRLANSEERDRDAGILWGNRLHKTPPQRLDSLQGYLRPPRRGTRGHL